MKTVFILSYNNLGLDFWKNHLNLDESDKVYQFRKGDQCLRNMNCLPNLVIVDEYFAHIIGDDMDGEEVVRVISEKHAGANCFHISPNNTYLEQSGVDEVFRSNFNHEVINKINAMIRSDNGIAA